MHATGFAPLHRQRRPQEDFAVVQFVAPDDLVVPARNVRNLLLVVGLLARASWIIFATRCACLGPPSAAAASHNAQEQHGNRLDGRVMVQSFTRLGPQAHAGEVWLSIF